MMKIEQTNKNGEIVINYDNILKKPEILKILNSKIIDNSDIFININSKYFQINYKETVINIYFKNLTYLGNPHPKHKKRIQIGLNEEEFKNYCEGKLYIVGLYYYDENLTFIIPKLSNLENRKWNNSSVAHVYTIDLIESIKFGNFKKVDKNNNTIYLFQNISEMLDFIIDDKFTYKNEPLKILENFVTDKIQKMDIWYGKTCYEEMIKGNFKDKFQSEWIGFYFEYLFYDYLLKHNISDKIFKYLNVKNNSDVFDLWILDSYYGDLKTHSLNSSAILGNDKAAILNAIKKYDKIWLITLFHQPIYDREHNFQLTKFWNGLLKKENIESYGERMKNRTLLSKILVLEITNKNIEYLKIFNQGKNSGKNYSKRNPKIKIDSKDFENFVIYRKFF